MRRRLALFALILSTVTSPAMFQPTRSDATESADQLCLGQVPTIVGTPGGVVVGTEGADVVVTSGSARVDTGDGDDLVCITGDPDLVPWEGQVVFTGPGSDRVDASKYVVSSSFSGDVVSSTYLGDGADVYLGGPAAEYVADADDFVDVIRTEGGRDRVDSGGGSDVVDLGGGADSVYLHGGSGVAVLDGGGGVDQLAVESGAPSWTVDNRAEWLLAGELRASWSSFVVFTAIGPGTVSFRGSGEDEYFQVFGGSDPRPGVWVPNEQPDYARMGGGDDVVTFDGGAAGSLFNGGDGRDKIRYTGMYVAARLDIFVDLSRGILRETTGRGVETTRRAVNFEDAAIWNWTYQQGRTLIKGTSGPNQLTSHVGQAEPPSRTTIDGRGEDDVLVGSRGDDLLIGGTGHDTARGGSGFDRCDAETRIDCER